MTYRDRITDVELEQLAELLPPDPYDLERVTPWKQAAYRTLWGLGLYTVMLNHSPWNVIQPVLGLLLLLLGLRALRRENRGFALSYDIAWMQTACFLYKMAAKCTVFQDVLLPQWLAYVRMVLDILLIAALWQGFRRSRKKAGLSSGNGPFLFLLGWYGALLGLGLSGANGLPVLALLAAYIAVLAALFALARQLYTAGYALRPAAKRLPDWMLCLLLTLALLLAMVAGWLLGGQYPMAWQPRRQTPQTEAAQHLLELGFPADLLADLRPEDVESCAGAVEIVVQGEVRGTGYARQEPGSISTTHGRPDLQMTHVAVKLSDAPQRWRIFHHFRWLDGAWLNGTEAIQVWPTTGNGYDWQQTEAFEGWFLCERDGQTMTSHGHTFGVEHYVSDSLFFGSQTRADFLAAFSYPKDSIHQRGYVSYAMVDTDPQRRYVIDSWLNYEHQNARCFPVQQAIDVLRRGTVYPKSTPFILVQDTLQFNPWQ